MTAIDRRQIIEDAARAMHNTAGQWPWERLSAEEPLWAEGWRDNAKAALPVIVAAALKPIRDLHSPHARTQYDDQECEDSACDHYDELEDRWWCPGHPVWICRACDQGADGRVLAPCPTARLCDEIEAAAKGGE